MRPGKLTNAFQDHQQGKEKEHETIHDWKEWGGYQKTLGALLVETYPRSKKETNAKEPEWTLKLEKWGTQKEIDELEYAPQKKKHLTARNRKKRTRNEAPTQTPSETRDTTSMERRRKMPTRTQEGNSIRKMPDYRSR